MTPAETTSDLLRREVEHLTARCAVLQGKVWDLSGRLAQALQRIERLDGSNDLQK